MSIFLLYNVLDLSWNIGVPNTHGTDKKYMQYFGA